MSKKLNLILSSGLLISPIPLMSTVSCSNSTKSVVNASETDYSFSFDDNNLTAKVTKLKNWSATFINIPKKVKNNGWIYTVTSIGYGAFDNKGEISELILPDTIVNIESYAFRKCSFNKIKWSKQLKNIGYSSFYYSSFQQDLILPDSVETIDQFAFWCSKIGKIHLSKKIKSISANAFYGAQIQGDLILPDSLESIGGHAFQGSGFNGKLKLPKNPKLTTIPTAAFQNNSFSSIEIFDNITTIGGYAFYGSMNGEELIIPKSVTSIGNWAFYIRENSPIKKITIYKSTYGGSSSNAFGGFKGEWNKLE